VYTAEGAEYFAKLLPKVEKDVFEDCGHFMAIDKPEKTAQSIVTFLNSHFRYSETTSCARN
jgi:pimeloyl-ACP methyl ester carboxylesterase